MRHGPKVLAVGLMVALGLAWRAAPATGADPVTFVLDWVQYGAHVGWYEALGGGFFKEAGIDGTIQRGYGSGDTVKRIGAKSGEFGFADTGTLVVARTKGAKVKSLGVLHNKAPHTIYAMKSSGIRTMKDLSGRHYGDTVGGATHTLFEALAKIHGVKDWTFTALSPTAKNPALLAKQVDFIATFADVGPALRAGAEQAKDEIVELRWADNGLDFHGNVVVVHDETIQGRPDLVGRFVNAAFKGVARAIKDPQGAVETFIKHNPGLNPVLVRQQWEVMVTLAYTEETKAIGLGGLSPKKMKETIDLITQYQNLPARPPESEVYAPQFLKKTLP